MLAIGYGRGEFLNTIDASQRTARRMQVLHMILLHIVPEKLNIRTQTLCTETVSTGYEVALLAHGHAVQHRLHLLQQLVHAAEAPNG